jgi:maltose O-acetyltransferase
MSIEYYVLTLPRSVMSRIRIFGYRILGLKVGGRNRFEEHGRVRRCRQILIGDSNTFSSGYRLWPLDSSFEGLRITIGSGNYMNRNFMVDACGSIEIGSDNMFGPDVYITDSNHRTALGVSPKYLPMQSGFVKVGNRCWVGAQAVVLKDVELGDNCVVGAGSVVTRSVPAGAIVAGVPAKIIGFVGSGISS